MYYSSRKKLNHFYEPRIETRHCALILHQFTVYEKKLTEKPVIKKVLGGYGLELVEGKRH